MRTLTKHFKLIIVAFIFSNLFTKAQDTAKVYIGGGDEKTGAYLGYINDPSGWTWVRQYADGYYVNTFPMNDNANDATQNAWMKNICGLFKNKNVFYETEAQSYANRVFDADDKARISILQQNGFKVTYTTCNGDFTATRANLLETWSGTRPLYAMMGPWVIGGDINSSNAKAIQWRNLIDSSNGSATDSPMAIWVANTNNCRNGSYSGIKYAHAHGKKAMIMMCPHDLKTNANFYNVGKQYIHDHEDNDAFPDFWCISYYAAYLEAHQVTPEQINGQPDTTITGMGYFLIHHLKDPDKAAKLLAPSQKALSLASYGADIQLDSATQTFQINLANSSSWLDVIPVIKARIIDSQSAWNVTFQYNGHDVTSSIISNAGLCFYKINRLNPGNTKIITVTIASKTGLVSKEPLSIYFDLLPHPTIPIVNQTFQMNYDSLQQPYGGTPATIPGIVESENYDLGGEGVAYHDSDTGNTFKAYRNDDVDIESCTAGGYDVASIVAGEWLEYTVNVDSTGQYEADVRVASLNNTTSLNILFDGVDKSGTLTTAATSGWQTWTSIKKTMYLTAGKHIMRINFNSSGFNLDKVIFTFIPGTMPESKGNGLNGNYYNDNNFLNPSNPSDPLNSYTQSGIYWYPKVSAQFFTTSALYRTDTVIDFNWGSNSPSAAVNKDYFSARWQGFIKPLYSEIYTFYLTSDDGSTLTINGNKIIDMWRAQAQETTSDTITLKAAQKYPISVEFMEVLGPAMVKLEWQSATQPRQVVPKSQLYSTPTGIEQLNTNLSSEILIYPNPAKTQIKIESEKLKVNKIIISDVQGRTIFQSDKSFSGSKTIDVSGFANGIYFIKVGVKDFVTTQKLIINK